MHINSRWYILTKQYIKDNKSNISFDPFPISFTAPLYIYISWEENIPGNLWVKVSHILGPVLPSVAASSNYIHIYINFTISKTHNQNHACLLIVRIEESINSSTCYDEDPAPKMKSGGLLLRFSEAISIMGSTASVSSHNLIC